MVAVVAVATVVHPPHADPVQAPEVMSGEKAGPAADVYSFGVVLWELCTLELPWSKTGPYQVLDSAHCMWTCSRKHLWGS